MMWVCRSGQQGKCYNRFLEEEKIYLMWDGYRKNLHGMSSFSEFRELVIKESNPEGRTTISNWAGQLYSFAVEMQLGDYVLIPGPHSRVYTLARICGEYEFDAHADLTHSRKIEIVQREIPRESFKQSTQYSLGAFRTIFKVKQEIEVLQVAQDIGANRRNRGGEAS